MFDERDLGRGLLSFGSRGLAAKAAVALAMIGVASLLILAPFGGGTTSQAACLPGLPGQGGDVRPKGPLRQVQVGFAQLIDQIARDRGLPGKATLIAIMTGLVESELQNLDYGHADSLGIFQQRHLAGWGEPDQIRDPVYAINAFFGGDDPPSPPGLVDINGWPSMALGDAAQKVQVSAFPDRYAQRESEARDIATEAGIDLTRPGNPYAGRSGAPTAGSGDGVLDSDDDCGGGEGGLTSGQPVNGVWPPERQSVTDPTGTGGLVTPRTANWVAEARKNLGTLSMSCWDAHLWNPASDHPRGKACDIMVGADSRRSAPAKARGDQIANWAITTAGTTGVRYVIWYGKIWSSRRGTWIPYNGGGVYVPTDATGGHYDHVHVSMW
ncbi:hypothetical protein HPO96_02915 [Kribbella sandramycini]|uniref:ARB-07466-like C-terminal domain-containing protein n=1 Tax=Kribbella sandramycini TaxID=60450 RepID=A0A7Y4KUY9_9ACTN|nr:hypothetical protein [Kribbella sandramycini]MBB6568218.1 hypothetical protein [Kribbella sandramycini]NOL39188.1 hypothetical protein [Kribbella sandramycini]